MALVFMCTSASLLVRLALHRQRLQQAPAMLPLRYPARHATCSGSVLFPAVTAPGASGGSARSTRRATAAASMESICARTWGVCTMMPLRSGPISGRRSRSRSGRGIRTSRASTPSRGSSDCLKVGRSTWVTALFRCMCDASHLGRPSSPGHSPHPWLVRRCADRTQRTRGRPTVVDRRAPAARAPTSHTCLETCVRLRLTCA